MDIFAAYSPCFAVPYDYADRYWGTKQINPDANHVTVLAGRHRHWRTVSSTTVTYVARLEALIYYNHTLPHPLNDYENSVNIYKSGGIILAPLPSLASHTESFDSYHNYAMYLSLYFDWCLYGRNLVDYIKTLPRSLYWSS